MISRLHEHLKQLPSIQAFISSLIDDVADRRSVVVFTPVTIDPDWLWSAVSASLWARSFSVDEIKVTRLKTGDGVAATIGEALGVRWPSSPAPRDVSSLLSCDDLPDIIRLDGVDDLKASEQMKWLRFVQRWAQVSQDFENDSMPPVLFIISQWANLEYTEIESDVRLAVHWWWGFPSILELKLLCRVANSEQPYHDLETQWREHLLPAIAGSDLVLFERLWNESSANKDHIISRLQELANERNWTKTQLQQWGALNFSNNGIHRLVVMSDSAPRAVRMLWANGVAYATDEFGLELHPSALLILDREAKLEHRLWRGQAELLLPSLDSIRLDLCNYLTRQYGASWPVKWLQPEHPEDEAAVRESPLAAGWGYLKWLISNCPELSREKRWLSLIGPASRTRNKLAHYRSVSFNDYKRLMDQHRRFIKKI